jgi:hypothetical protein
LTSLLSLIADNTSAQTPLFVFVDELDRCRPSYAIKLLEEIKHVFGVENVVYVVSTNIEQLQNSVRALYGAEFDGRRYLHRLFDREYSLPSANNRQFANVAIRQDSAITSRQIATGLPSRSNTNVTLHDSWSLVSDAFALDFRTQRQVFELADEVATGIAENLPIHALWLFFLCALRYLDMHALERIARGDISKQSFGELISRLLRRDMPISFRRPAQGRYEDAEAPLSQALSIYFDASKLSARELFQKEVNSYDYPNSIYQIVGAEYGGALYGDSPPPSIRSYAGLVRTAGFLTA